MARRQAGRCWRCYYFVPHLHAERLPEPLRRRKPARIGVAFMGDLFGAPSWMTQAVLEAIWRAPQHAFVLLTKRAEKLPDFVFPSNCWVGVTVNSERDLWRIDKLREVSVSVRWASFEPIYGPIDADLSGIDWVVLGAQTRPALQPEREWVETLVREARRVGAAVFVKDNLDYEPKYREFPRAGRVV
jgi:protein gp37